MLQTLRKTGLVVTLAVAMSVILTVCGGASQEERFSCDPSYPDFCISRPPPDLDCGDISGKNFKVLAPDPHRFDRDKDGVGCEG